jgi:hypothetical protein
MDVDPLEGPIPPRRNFLAICTSLLAALLGLMIAVPGLGYFIAPLRGRSERTKGQPGFQPVGPLDSWPVGQWTLVSFEVVNQDGWEKATSRRSVWVRLTKTALSPSFTIRAAKTAFTQRCASVS